MTYDVVIAGGGMSGLAAAYTLATQYPNCRFLLIESGNRMGGVAQTVFEGGYLLESGPNSIQGRSQNLLTLARELRLQPIEAAPTAKNRYVYHKGHLHRVPMNPIQLLTSGLLSPAAKVRLLSEPFQPKGKSADDESVASFVRRRLGAEVLKNLLGPFLSGIYAGDPELLSVKSIFPKLTTLEKEAGSLFKSMFQSRKGKIRSGQSNLSKGHTLYSFEAGLQALPDAMVASIPAESLRLNTSVEKIQALPHGGYSLRLGPGEEIESRCVILSTPAPISAQLLQSINPDFSRQLQGISYAPLAVVHLGFLRNQLNHPLDGFGFLTAQETHLSLLGCIWASSLFKNRAPSDQVLLTCYVGGARFPDAVHNKAPETLIDETLHQVRQTLGQSNLQPVFSKVFMHQRAIPQYTIGHEERIKKLHTSLTEFPGLFLSGNYLTGVSLEGTLQSGIQAANRAAEHWQECRQPVRI